MNSRLVIGGLVLVALLVVTVGLTVRHNPKATAPAVGATTAKAQIRYLPLGDSYTIGESVAQSERWPDQLVAKLQAGGSPSIAILANPAVTGYTSQDLIDRELPLVAKLRPNFVTIQIGVNDYVQGVSAGVFQSNLNHILDTVMRQLPSPQRLLLVTIPDYGKTPTGAQYGTPASSEAGVRAFNKIISDSAAERRLPVADVFPASQRVSAEPSLIAPDGLHPSGKQYARWVDAIYPLAKTILLP